MASDGSGACGIAKTCRSARSTRTAFASELGEEGPLGVLVSYYKKLGFG